MDLVRKDEDVELRGKIGKPEQLLTSLYPTDRVVRVTQDHRPRAQSDKRGPGDGEITGVSPLPIAHERHADRGVAIILDNQPERVVDRSLGDGTVAELRENPDGVSQSRDHTSGGDD